MAERRKGRRRSSDKEGARGDKPKLTNEHSIGTIEHDERGDARWVWASEHQAQESLERTFDELKALDNETLSLLDQPAPAPGKQPPGGGYNPYNTTKPATTPAPKKTAKGRR